MDLLPISSEIRCPNSNPHHSKKKSPLQLLSGLLCCTVAREPLPHGMGLCSAQPVQLYPASLVVVWGFSAWTVLRVSPRGKGMGRSMEWD